MEILKKISISEKFCQETLTFSVINFSALLFLRPSKLKKFIFIFAPIHFQLSLLSKNSLSLQFRLKFQSIAEADPWANTSRRRPKTESRFPGAMVNVLYKPFSKSSRIYCLLCLAVGTIRQILDGLKVVHDKNVVHCDISPGNVLLRNKDLSDVVRIFQGCFWKKLEISGHF